MDGVCNMDKENAERVYKTITYLIFNGTSSGFPSANSIGRKVELLRSKFNYRKCDFNDIITNTTINL